MRLLLWDSRLAGAPTAFASDRFGRRRCHGLRRRLSRSFVKWSRNYLSLGFLVANFHVDGRRNGGDCGWDVGKRIFLAKRGGSGAPGYPADGLAYFIATAVAVTRDTPLHHLQPDERARQARGLGALQSGAADEVALFHFAVAIQSRFPNIDFVADRVHVKRHLDFQAQAVGRAEPEGKNAELAPGFDHFGPDLLARRLVGRHINLETVFPGIAGARDQNIFQAADSAMRKPIILDRAEICVGEFLHYLYRARPLNRELRVSVAQFFHDAVKIFHVLPNPIDVFLARTGIDDQQIIVLAEAMHNHVIDKRALRIQHRRIVSLPNCELRCVIHADVLYRHERASLLTPRSYADASHVAAIEKPHAAAHGLVLRDQAAARRVLARHVPAVKINHFRARTAAQRVQRRLAGFVDSGRVGRFHSAGSGKKTILARAHTRVKEAHRGRKIQPSAMKKSLPSLANSRAG